ncbi:hypothetical protein AX14_014297 [Amanita brunnescens Koide BX004]|nr:hypothetical protein AX14_014297 [Amanita brunnescens Koide BX004]
MLRRDRDRRSLALSQRSYLASIIRRYGFEDLKPISIPMDVNIRLPTTQSPSTSIDYAEMRDIPYHETVGSAMYATIATRPDTAYPVQTVSRFSSNPGLAHWKAVKKMYQYYKGTTDLWLTYGGGQKQPLTGYSDADGSMGEDRKAILGIYSRNPRSQRSPMAPLPYHAALRGRPRANRSVLRQPIRYRTNQRPPVPLTYQAYRYPLPLHPMDCLLPN